VKVKLSISGRSEIMNYVTVLLELGTFAAEEMDENWCHDDGVTGDRRF
jgi:hypothetical protein